MFKSFHNTAPNTLDKFKWTGFRETSSIPQHLKPIQPSFTNFSNFERKHVPMKPDFAGVYSKDLLNAPKPFQFTYDLSPMRTLNLEGKTPTLSQAIDANNKQKYLDDLKIGLFTGNVSRPITPPPVTPPTSPPPLMSSSPPATPPVSRPLSPPPLMPSSNSSSTPNDAIPVMPVVTPAPANEEFTKVAPKKSKSKKAKSSQETPQKTLVIDENDDEAVIRDAMSYIEAMQGTKKPSNGEEEEEEEAIGTDITPFVNKFSEFRRETGTLSAKKQKSYAHQFVTNLNKFISTPDKLLPETLNGLEKEALIVVGLKDTPIFPSSSKANEKIDKFRKQNLGRLKEIKSIYFKTKPIQEEFDDERTRHAQYT